MNHQIKLAYLEVEKDARGKVKRYFSTAGLDVEIIANPDKHSSAEGYILHLNSLHCLILNFQTTQELLNKKNSELQNN